MCYFVSVSILVFDKVESKTNLEIPYCSGVSKKPEGLTVHRQGSNPCVDVRGYPKLRRSGRILVKALYARGSAAHSGLLP